MAGNLFHADGINRAFSSCLIGITKNDLTMISPVRHILTCIVAQKSLMPLDIIKWNLVLYSPSFHFLPDEICRLFLKDNRFPHPLLYQKYPGHEILPHPAWWKSAGSASSSATDTGGWKKYIPVCSGSRWFFRSANDGHHGRQFQFPDPFQALQYLVLFVFQLFVIGKHLPLATPADAEMLAKGLILSEEYPIKPD